MQFKSPLLVSVLLCLLSLPAWAATYYVDVNGNNANAGTAALPWRTLQYAVDRVAAGDTVIVRAGTYAGFRIGRSGTASAPITIKADAGVRPLLNAVSAANRHQSIIEVENFEATVTYVVIEGFEVANAPRHGIDVRVTDYVTVRNCLSHDNGKSTLGDGILTGFSDHVLLQGNECWANSEHGIYHSNSADYPTIRGNKLYRNARAGLHMNGDLSLGGDGQISFGLIEKNVIYENGAGGGSGINCDGVSDSVIRNNLLYNNRASGISLYATDGAQGSSNNKVYHNTVVMAANARWAMNIPASTNGQSHPVNNEIKNNIFIHPDTRGSITAYATTQSVLRSDYNIIVNRFSRDDGNSFIDFNTWKTTGQDAHSIISTSAALFVDAAAGNYQLKATALALNAGVTGLNVNEDIAGTARPQGSAPDIGCYELATGTPNPTPTPTPTPTPSVFTTVNAASYAAPPLAANAIVAGFGANLTTTTAVANTIPLPTTLGGAQVKVTDSTGTTYDAPLFFVSPSQINYLIPNNTALGTATVKVMTGTTTTAQGTATIAAIAPGVFTLNASGSGIVAGVVLRIPAGSAVPVYESLARWDATTSRFVAIPIDLGVATDQVFLVLFGTGWRGRSGLGNVSVTVGGTSAAVSFAGATGGLVGLDQLNVSLPRALIGRGEVNVTTVVDGKATNPVKVTIK